MNWLATTDRRRVVVLDDVQDSGDMHGLWPPDSGRTIVTTRRRDAALQRTDRRIIEVAPYSANESLAYLRSKVVLPNLIDGAADLAADLGGLPLALAQAAAFVQDAEVTCAEYVRQFRAGRDVAPDALPDEHQHTVNLTWALSIERADELTPKGAARPLLELLSFLDPNGIPSAVATTAVTLAYLGIRAGRHVSVEDSLRAVQVLRRLSLVDTDQAHAHLGIRVHALVQHATRAANENDELIANIAAQALVDIWPDIERDTQIGQGLRANAAALMQHALTVLWSHGGHAVLHRHGRSLGEAGLAGAAKNHFERICTAASQALGADHTTTLTMRGELGTWRGYSGDVAGAIIELERLLTDRLRLKGPQDLATLTTRHNLAYWRGEAGDLAGAVAELDRQLEIECRMLGPDDPNTLTTRHSRALWRSHADGAASVITEFEDLLADWIRVRGTNDPAL